MFILLTSLLTFTADSDKSLPPSYEKVMEWVDTVSSYNGYDYRDDGAMGDWRDEERQRYRCGPRLPEDNLDPTYYLSPWHSPRGIS
jgi:hypothetical protein